MKKIITLFVTLIVVSGNVLAFDDRRKGFIVSVGGGMHSVTLNYDVDGVTSAVDRYQGIATNFKIGYGINSRYAAYFVRQASWYSSPMIIDSAKKDTVTVVGISGIGVSRYFSLKRTSPYLQASIGIGDIMAPFESSIKPDTGMAYMFGVGQGFTKNISAEMNWLLTNLGSADMSSLSVKTFSPALTINYMWY